MMQRLLLLPAALGVLLHLYTAFFRADGPFSAFLLGLLLASCLPYVLTLLLPLIKVDRLAAAFGAFAALVADVAMHYSVFIAPKGSTAALGLLFMPVWNLVVVVPVAVLLAWLALKLWRRRHPPQG